jgi:RND family efflux transporter MFP subunit
MRPRPLPLLALAAVLAAGAPVHAAEFEVRPVEVADVKAVFGRVESRFVVPARARIGGTLVALEVAEGDLVAQGARIARVDDEKIAPQLAAADARVRATRSELTNARTEYERAQQLFARGAVTQARVDDTRTRVDVLANQVAQAEAERAVVAQQAAEGDVIAPVAGRVLTVPSRRGAVVLPGEPVATVAGGGVFLRLALPERHATLLAAGAAVEIGEEGGRGARRGRVERVYPLIENGRVTADVAVEGLSDAFVGARVLVRVPVATRAAIAVPPAAITTRAGLDVARIATPGGPREVSVVAGGLVETPQGPRREVLSGLRAGDRVILP